VTLNKMYSEEMRYLENLQCRATFFNILAYGYKTQDDAMADIDRSEETYEQLQKLIFNEISENQILSEKNSDKELLQACKKKIKKIYELLLNDGQFEKFSIQDILKRGKETIEAIRANDDLDLDDLRMTKLNTQVRAPEGTTLSDPCAVCFQATILVKLGKISFNSANNELVTLYEILLALSALFSADIKSKASETLLDACVDIMRAASQQLEQIEDKEYVLNHLINSKLMKWLCSGLNFDTIFKANQRKKKFIQMHTLMF